MYEGLMERAMITVRVFEKREAAAEWLGVPTADSISAEQEKMKTSHLVLTALTLTTCLASSARSQQANQTSSQFVATISNSTAAPKPAPEGMVWIPGGEFSMGASVNGHGSCEMPMASNDTEPIHRVRVDGILHG
jgi:formylglycine-generating enzyme required for sulfatase activity